MDSMIAHFFCWKIEGPREPLRSTKCIGRLLTATLTEFVADVESKILELVPDKRAEIVVYCWNFT